jgi:hypothetical protein
VDVLLHFEPSDTAKFCPVMWLAHERNLKLFYWIRVFVGMFNVFTYVYENWNLSELRSKLVNKKVNRNITLSQEH